MKFIGLGHRKGVGKDTLAKMMADTYADNGVSVRVLSFADGVKDLSYTMFKRYGLASAEFYEENREAKEEPIGGVLGDMSPREIYIKVGMFMRSFDPDYWVDDLLRRAEEMSPIIVHSDTIIIVPDLRFPNEARTFKEHGYPLVHVVNPRVQDTSDEADDALVHFGGWDHLVVNDCNLCCLQEHADSLCREITL